jgi:hypothetical protein
LGAASPPKPDGCKKLLDLLANARVSLGRYRAEVASVESDPNANVYRMYGVTPDEQETIESSLERYSSQSAAENDDQAGEV